MNWKDYAMVHAKEQDPKESCGLLLNIRGKERYYPCRNLSMTAYQCFIIDPEDYVKQSNLPWHIVNPKTEQWGYYEPCGYKPPLLGRPWVWGVTDCWSLVRDWYKEEKNIILKDWDRPTTPQEFLDNPLFESCFSETGFRELKPEEKLKNGDALLMSIGCAGLNHVAIFLDGNVLHHLADRISCKEPYNEWLLKCTGMRLRYAQES